MDAMQQTDAVPEGRRIYVGNLQYSVTPTDVETVLRETGLGNFEKIHLTIDSESGRNSGYCFIEFPTREAAEQALITLEGIAIYDRLLRVGPCHPRTPSSRKYDNGRPVSEGPTAQRWGDWRAGARPVSKSDEPDARSQQREQQQHEPENPESKRLYVGGLGPMSNQEQNDVELREIFDGFQIAAVGKRNAPHPSATEKPGNHHYAFVDFVTSEDAEGARRAVGGKPYSGGRLRVFHAKARSPKDSEDLVTADGAAASPQRNTRTFQTSSPAGKTRGEGTPTRDREERDGRQRVIMASNNWRTRAAPAAE
ncbi:hypothetical protein QBC34DRAFT_447624 [Podospora aff. communis PSN243]|uniref:RRM domain-containing protein n=1 Tax=Podospora aff. communis PSN243 TaxID=3040156 RepID=A0AAV9GSX1_9PEZI|nr:hypothetical protein QBC34DRAFT_447624 [Podospora aff. communis PSN243]